MPNARSRTRDPEEDLKSLISAAKSGATIRLAGKRYLLAASLVIDKPLTIRGAGPKTIIVGKSGRAVVIVGKKTRLRLEKLAIVREGKEPGHVVLCRGGSVVTLASCIVRGGKGKKGSTSIGAGVCTDGDVNLTIQDCTLFDHDLVSVLVAKRSRLRAVRNTVRGTLAAFYIADDAHADLETNTCTNPKTASIFFMDRSKGVARKNRCINGLNAFYVSGKSTPRIERNVCEGMTLVGIWVGGHASPTIASNRISNTKANAISIQKYANATVSDNDVSATKSSGISFCDNTKGTLDRNRVTGSKDHGIIISERSAPTVSRNECTKNGLSGLVATEKSTPKLVQNTCSRNNEYGIVVIDAARPRIEKNVVCENEEHGLWVRGSAQPTVIGNRFERNRGSGIAITEKSGGSYQDNRMIENASHGVLVEDVASPKLRKNICQQNGHHGILASDKSRPVLEQNVLDRNSGAGIEYWHRAAGTATKNICRKNEDSGICLVGDVSPTLTANECIGNDGNGIALDEDTDDVRPTQAKLRGNISRGNSGDDDESGGIGTHAAWSLLTKRVARTPPLKDYARQAWKPITKAGDGVVTASKFGGTPYFESDETWPCCGHCRKPMPLILQLDLARLPKAAAAHCGGRGLLQFFYCRNRNDSCSDYGAKSHLLRLLPGAKKGSKTTTPTTTPKKIEGSFPPKLIEGWRDFGEMIRWVELRDGLRRRMARSLSALGFTYYDGDDDVGDGPEVSPELGDKLLGWPCWIHDAPRMSCPRPRCTKAMRHLFQVDSEHNVPWMWGDSGTAWIFQCPTHRDSLALEWQCH